MSRTADFGAPPAAGLLPHAWAASEAERTAAHAHAVHRLARGGDPKAYALPKPLAKTQDAALRTGCDFSFAGLKSAVRPTPSPARPTFVSTIA